jgi:hypothetical protein
MILGGQYKILSEMGAGGMGVVYQPVDVMCRGAEAVEPILG